MPSELPIFLTLLLAAASPWWFGAARRSFLLFGALLHGGHLLLYGGQLAAVAGGGAVPVSRLAHAFPSGLIDVSFSANAWSLVFAMMITGIGLLIFLYALGYFGSSPKGRRFFAPLLAFEAAMLGVVLADDAVLLFLFWELTSVTSFFLIGFQHAEKTSRWNALQALLVTGLGGVAMLAGFLMLGHHWGTLSLGAWREQVAGGAVPPLAPLVLIVLGAMTKSALFPFFFWLPNAMSAPTPVSGFLHSATMVKAGIYLIGALHPLLETSRLLQGVLVVSGGLTALAGVCLGWVQTDLKKILAYTTLSILGILTVLLGVGSPEALKAAVLVMIGHACYKAGLFMTAGAVDKAAGTRDVRVLGGLRHALPVLAFSSLVLALSKCGFPPLLGFVGKEYAYKLGFMGPGGAYAVLALMFVVNVGLMALALRAALTPFRGNASPDLAVKPVGPLLVAGPAVLATLGLGLGLLAPSLLSPVVSAAVGHIHGSEVSFQLKLWHGINPAFLLSLVTLGAGWALYSAFPARGGGNALTRGLGVFETIYQLCHDGLMKGSARLTAALQTGNVNSYVRWFFVATLALVAGKWWASGFPLFAPAERGAWMDWALLPAFAGFLWLVVTSHSRILALLALAVIGLGVAFLFARMGAPDVALTLLLVETLTVVLFLRIVRGLPRLRNITPRRQRGIDIGLSAAVGGMMALLALKVGAVQTHPSISATLSEWSLPLAKGRNIVNVILVDFRALDTLGEITVIALAAVGVSILWKRGRSAAQATSETPAP